MILRIIDKQTKIFLRDDFEFNPETEIGLDVEPAQGLYAPKWDGTQWIESATDIPVPSPPEPTEADRLAVLEMAMLEIIMGGLS